MGRLPLAQLVMRHFKFKAAGLTLLEVLIALVILAVALTAVIKATAENIRSTHYLQEKNLATWIGLNILHKAQLDLIKLPGAPEHLEETEITLNQSWKWQAFSTSTPNKHIHELHVKVFHQPDHRFITELTSYHYDA